MLKRLAQLEFAIAAIILGVIVVLVFIAAIMRFFGYPLIWSVDMAQLLFICSASSGRRAPCARRATWGSTFSSAG